LIFIIKRKMQFLRVLGLLSFLVTGNLAFAISIDEDLRFPEDSSSSMQFNEELQDLGESTFTGTSVILVLQPVYVFNVSDFVFRGSNSAQKANDYICYSATIKPGLDIQKIIFPFHTFL